jgi:hypothetical protein
MSLCAGTVSSAGRICAGRAKPLGDTAAEPRQSQRVREVLVSGVSTSMCATSLPKMGGTVGVAKSRVLRKFIEASRRELQTDMVLRWTAASCLQAGKAFRRIRGSLDLWVLTAALGRRKVDEVVQEPKVAQSANRLPSEPSTTRESPKASIDRPYVRSILR